MTRAFERPDIWRMPAHEQAALVADRTLSPVDLVEESLSRLDQLDPSIHAVSTPDHDGARQTARRQEKALANGETLGPMAGVPILVKDLIAVRGMRMTGGSPAYRDFIADEDDIVVERLRRAGAIVLGKTNVSEMGYTALSHNPIHRTTRNPWDMDMTPGGSSAGSAAAVAAGICSVSLGSDGGGSVRAPAAHCGLVGFKPSMGRVPLYPGCRDERYPGFSSWESLEHIGPIARDVMDVTLMMRVIAGPDHRDRHSIPCDDLDWAKVSERQPGKAQVAYCPAFSYVTVDDEVRRIVGEAVKTLAHALGADLVECAPVWENPATTFWATVALDTDLRGMRELAKKYGPEMSPELMDLLDRPWTAEELTDAVRDRKAFVNSMSRFMSDYDLLVTPTTTVPPFGIDTPGPETVNGNPVDPTAWTAFTMPFNLTGQPAVSVPAGWTTSGLPVGMQIVGRHLDDSRVLSAAATFQQAADWRHQWPALATRGDRASA